MSQMGSDPETRRPARVVRFPQTKIRPDQAAAEGVTTGKAQAEQYFSARTLAADMRKSRCSRSQPNWPRLLPRLQPGSSISH